MTYAALHGFAVPDNPTFDPAAADQHWQAMERLFGAPALTDVRVRSERRSGASPRGVTRPGERRRSALGQNETAVMFVLPSVPTISSSQPWVSAMRRGIAW